MTVAVKKKRIVGLVVVKMTGYAAILLSKMLSTCSSLAPVAPKSVAVLPLSNDSSTCSI